MSEILLLFQKIFDHYRNNALHISLILAVLIAVTIMAVYEFLVYRFILHRALYNKSFNICIALIPYFIASIIMCLQSNLVITLGTIGALAIIRFRTAVKDPIDIIFILWSIQIGIMCGCQLYEVGILTSLVATIVLVILNRVSIGKNSYVLMLEVDSVDAQQEVSEGVSKFVKKYKIKSRNFSNEKFTLIYEMQVRDASALTEELSKMSSIKKFSLLEYDPDDII